MEEKTCYYADYAATTPIAPEVAEAMAPYFEDRFGNPSSSHRLGRTAKEAVRLARDETASLLGASPEEIFFTSCATESLNWAVKGAAMQAFFDASPRRRILVSAVEHPAVLQAAESLRPFGFSVERAPVDGNGVVDLDAFRVMVRDDCFLCAVMHANNETGVVEPVEECAAMAHEKGALFLTDAVQTAGHIPVDVRRLDCDFLALSGHKLHAPKGVGALYIRKGRTLPPLIDGGGQERGERSGTENVPYLVGLGEACRLSREALAMGEEKRVAVLRDGMAQRLLSLGGCRVNGEGARRVPGILSVSFACVEGESLMLVGDLHGAAFSTGSACASGRGNEVSHVLRAMEVPEAYRNGSIRLSVGRYTTAAEACGAAEIVADAVVRLRAVSVEWERYMSNGNLAGI